MRRGNSYSVKGMGSIKRLKRVSNSTCSVPAALSLCIPDKVMCSAGDFLEAVTQTENVVCHFFHRDFERCKLLDKHLSILARKYFDTRFIKVSAPVNFLNSCKNSIPGVGMPLQVTCHQQWLEHLFSFRQCKHCMASTSTSHNTCCCRTLPFSQSSCK